MPWSLGSSADEAVLQESGLGLGGSLLRPHCRNLSVRIFFGVAWTDGEQGERLRQRKEFSNKHLPASGKDPRPN